VSGLTLEGGFFAGGVGQPVTFHELSPLAHFTASIALVALFQPWHSGMHLPHMSVCVCEDEAFAGRVGSAVQVLVL
jgi:hypothetical protein